MRGYGLTNRLAGGVTNAERKTGRYHSVEFHIKGLETPYQFKIWNTVSSSMCVLVREDSGVLPKLKEGETFSMKYYTNGSLYPSPYMETAIRSITKSNQGPFKGHYLVGLEILCNLD